MLYTITKEQLREEEQHMITTFLYFDIFNHPLKYEELIAFSNTHEANIDTVLQSLMDLKMVEKAEGFYFLRNKKWTVERRKSERKRLKKHFRIARLITSLISRFPYVRGVFLSGSLSKYRIEKDGDIDFFIVTKPGRLWIARTSLILFKKIFLLNSYRYFCLNYFVDTDSLKISPQNRFVATEIATLIPVYNYSVYEEILKANNWVERYFPYSPKRSTNYLVHHGSLLQGFFERIFNLKWFDKLDTFLMKRTLQHRKRKFRSMAPAAFEKSFLTQKNKSKHHPVDFQVIVSDKLKEKMLEFEKEYDVDLKK